MSKESYVRGFCKAAEAAGIDPIMLVKLSQAGILRDGPTVDNAKLYDGGFRATKSNMIRYFNPKSNVPRTTPWKPEFNSHSLLSKPKLKNPSIGSRVRRIASNLHTGLLDSIFPGLGTGFNRLSKGIAGRIKSFKYYDPERSRIMNGPWGRLFDPANKK